MVDATFSVQVVMDLVNKGTKKGFADIEKSTERVNKNLSKQGPSSNLNDINAQTEGYLQNGKALNNIIKLYGVGSKQAAEYFNTVTQGSVAAGKALKRATKVTTQFNFAFLSLIFGGMALQRVFGGMFKTIIAGYKDFADKNDVFVQETNQLGAAFTYLKFIIGRAFADSPAVRGLLDTLTGALNRLGAFFDDHPTFAIAIVSTAGALALLGIAMFALGTATQLVMGGSGTFGAAGETMRKFSNYTLAAVKAVGLFLLANPILAAMVVLLALGAYALAKYPEMAKPLVNLWEDEITPAIKESVQNILAMFGWSVELDDVWQAIAATFVYVMGILSIGLRIAISKVEFMLNFFNIIFKVVVAITNALNNIATRNFTEGLLQAKSDLKDIGNAIKNINPLEAIAPTGEEISFLAGGPEAILKSFQEARDTAQEESSLMNASLQNGQDYLSTLNTTNSTLATSKTETDSLVGSLGGLFEQIGMSPEVFDPLNTALNNNSISFNDLNTKAEELSLALDTDLTPKTDNQTEALKLQNEEIQKQITLYEQLQAVFNSGFSSGQGSSYSPY
jgi:hypothetical protein